MKRLLSLLAPAAALLLLATPATAQVTFDTFDDGDVSDITTFSGGGGIGVGTTDGRTGAPATALSVGIDPPATGGYAGFVVTGGAGVTDVSSTNSLTFYFRPTTVMAGNLPLNLEINFQEDVNGNGTFDGVDDEFQAVYPVAVGSGYTKVTIPLASFTDDNSFAAGANNGFDYTKLLHIVVAFGGPTGSAYAFAFDDIVFESVAPPPPPVIVNVLPFDYFDDGNVSDVFTFSGTGGGIGVGPTDGRLAAANTALSVGINPAQVGGFAGFGIPGSTVRHDVSGKTHLRFWFRPTTVMAGNLPFNLEINLHEDSNSNGTYEGGSEDEFQAVYPVAVGSGWTEVIIPLSSFTDDNAVFPGANNGFDYTKLLEIVIAFPTPPGGEFAFGLDDIGFGTLNPAPPTVDGSLDEALYTSIATGGVGTSFGPNINASEIKYYIDLATERLYIGVVGKLDQTNNNGIGLWLGTNAQTGVAAGSPLGVNGNGNGHYMSGNSGANANFAADFEVDYMFAVNPGSAANAYLDAARRWGGPTGGAYIGNSAGANGTAATGTGPVGGSITFAFHNGGGANQGLEISMPLSELGATVTSNLLRASAMVVSNDAYFSDDMVPGFPTAARRADDAPSAFGSMAEPGYNANFNTLPGGPFSSSAQALPVELVSFSGLGTFNAARLAWTTASETNNSGFYVEQHLGDTWTAVSGLLAGRGTTTERTDYRYDVNGLTAGRHTFRLRQVDTDGTVNYSGIVAVEVGIEGEARVTLLGQRAVRIETNDAQAVTVRVFDVLGRALASQEVSVDGTGVVGLPTLAPGAYFVRVEGERFSATKRLVVR